MHRALSPGSQVQTSFVVEEGDTAAFGGVEVHPVCSTFAMAREAEWACRQFVLQMREEHEEGIGNGLTIEHQAPALLGEQVEVVATLTAVQGNEVRCTWQALAGTRLLASGTCSQRVLDRSKLQERFDRLRSGL